MAAAAAAGGAGAGGEKKPVVLVTGGYGLVGMGVQAVLTDADREAAEWVFVRSSDADLRDFAATKALFDRVQPTHVLHLAAQVGGLFKNMAKRVAMCRDNLAINSNVLECAAQAGVKRCLSCLSTCVMPDAPAQAGTLLTEKMVHDGPPHPSNAGYAHAKRMIDVLGTCYNSEAPEGSVPFTTFIPTNVYGPHDNFSIEDGHVLPGLMHKAYLAKQEKKPLIMWGTGKPLRQFIYSLDLGKLMVWALFNYADPEPLILSVSEDDEVSIKQVTQYVADAFGDVEVVSDDTKADGQFRKTASNAKLRGLLPDFQFTPLEKGIKDTVQWFQENYETARK